MSPIPATDGDAPPAAVVLAAGVSRRMGGANKLFLEMGGEPLLRRCVRRAVAAGLRPVVVVHASDPQAVGDALIGLPYRAVPLSGSPTPAASLRAALGVLPAGTAAAVVLLADMPFVTPAMLRRLVRRAGARPVRLLASMYGDVLAPPVFCTRPLWDELARLGGRGGAAALRLRHPAETDVVRWPPAAGCDVDRPADYTRALRLERRRSSRPSR